MKKLGTLGAVFLSTFWLAASHAADAGNGKLSEAVARQEAIYRGGEEQVAAGYTIDRGLRVYANGLPSGFDSALGNLGPQDRWLDIGAGSAQAILDYVTSARDPQSADGWERRGAKAQAVAMSIEDRRTPLWHKTAGTLGADQLQYLMDKRLREYSKEEIGQFQLITDVIGGFSYTDTLSVFMEKVLSLLAVNGTFFTVLQDVQRDDGASEPFYKGSPFTTELRVADGSEMKVCAWLKRISCVEVTCESRPKWTPPLEAYRVRKVCENVSVPALSLTRYEPGTPPERKFQLSN
jgi:hypothetical protein